MRIKQHVIELVRFSRPHTIIGTTFSVAALFFIALTVTQYSPIPYALFVETMIACLSANIYIVGLNQITDVKIDKINKPYLPLASGAFSLWTGYILITIGFVLSVVLAAFSGRYLLLTVVLSLLLGTAYSLPPVRLKRLYFWAAFCIISIRGVIVNVFLYLHFQYQMIGQKTLPLAIILLTVAMFGYSLVIAWFKDVPDMKGDAAHQIRTMSIRIGAGKVLLFGNVLLNVLLITLALISFFVSFGVNAWVMAIAHVLMLIALWIKSSKLNPKRREDITKYYLFIWTLFFLEYLCFAVAAGVQNL